MNRQCPDELLNGVRDTRSRSSAKATGGPLSVRALDATQITTGWSPRIRLMGQALPVGRARLRNCATGECPHSSASEATWNDRSGRKPEWLELAETGTAGSEGRNAEAAIWVLMVQWQRLTRPFGRTFAPDLCVG